MSKATYSPTVKQAYKDNPEWFNERRSSPKSPYDTDGYNMYGYDKFNKDRTGRFQSEYINDDALEILWDRAHEHGRWFANQLKKEKESTNSPVAAGQN